VGLQVGLIEEFAYRSTIAVIALSLLVTPIWVATARRWGRAPPSRRPRGSTAT
jgi:hypothetical protein